MAFTAGNTIDEARDQPPSFDPQRSPNKAAMRQLNRYVRQLAFLTVEKDSSTLAVTTEEITFPLVDFAAGYALPAYVYIRGGSLTAAGFTTRGKRSTSCRTATDSCPICIAPATSTAERCSSAEMRRTGPW